MISKVKSVQQDGTWNSKHDNALMYKHEYEFEDGTLLQASHKTQNPFKQGDEVEYNVTRESDTYGKSGNVKWVADNQQLFSGGKSDKVQTYIIRQSSLTRAIEHLTVLHADTRDSLTKENVTALAEHYAKWVQE